jgi:hypothetical protein
MINKIDEWIYQVKIRNVLSTSPLEVLFKRGNLYIQPDNISCCIFVFFNKAKIEENRKIFLFNACHLFLPKEGLMVYQYCIFLIRYPNSRMSNYLLARISHFQTLLEVREDGHANACRRLPIIAPGEMFKRVTFGFSPFTRNSFRGLEKSCYLRICMKNMKYE